MGTLACGWFLFYTDWFEVVGGLLAVGGVLSWLAFISNVLPKSRIEQMQDWFDVRFLNNRRTFKRLCIAGVIMFLLAGSVGTIELQTRDRPGDYLVRIHRPGDIPAPEQFVAVKSGERTRTLRFAFWMRYVAHVRGYPEEDVELAPFSKTRLVVPDSFARPVILIRPTVKLMQAVGKKGSKQMVVTVSGEGVPTRSLKMPFDGYAVWVGCGDDVDVPPRVQDDFKLVLEKDHPLLLPLWLRPQSLEAEVAKQAKAAATQPATAPAPDGASAAGKLEEPVRLKVGQVVKVEFFKDGGDPLSGPFEKVVASIDRWDDFPQILDVSNERTSPTR